MVGSRISIIAYGCRVSPRLRRLLIPGALVVLLLIVVVSSLSRG